MTYEAMIVHDPDTDLLIDIGYPRKVYTYEEYVERAYHRTVSPKAHDYGLYTEIGIDELPNTLQKYRAKR